ncbi:type I glyceraldehyde-3-phosphate dehydrogenase [Leucobacter sp. GX24907]
MAQRIAINGFGRIGRAVLRVLVQQSRDLEVVAINDLADAEVLAHLYNHDSVYGAPAEAARVEGDDLVVGTQRARFLAQPDPTQLPWKDLGVDVVVEATGRFTAADQARAHLDAGAARVLVSAPSSGADLTVVRGVNEDRFDPDLHRIVSNGSCTTNALAPLARVLHDAAGIEQGFVTTVHAYTQDQNLVDAPHRDLRRARAAGLNMVPTSTGAAKAIGLVLPELEGRLSGDAIRVPVPVGSIVELNASLERDTSVDELLAAYREAAEGRMAGVLEFSEEPLVSSDIVGRSASSIFDAGLLRVEGRRAKAVAWYDNEWGFSNRIVDVLDILAR